jgi:hypothetical protein
VAILLTRDENTPREGERKEHILVFIPFLDGRMPDDVPPVIWLMHVDKRGKEYKYEVGSDLIAPFRPDDTEASLFAMLSSGSSPNRKGTPSRRIRSWRSDPDKLAGRYRELMREFYLTPQKRNPFVAPPEAA